MIKVQIVEDNPDEAQILAKGITLHHEIKVIGISKDGDEAIKTYLLKKPDVLILDLNIPKKNGIEVLNYLCNLDYDERNKCNIIVISGHFKDYTFKSLCKVHSCLEKPFDINLLRETVKDVYNNYVQRNHYKRACKKLFMQLGFNPHNLSTLLLIDAVLLILNNKQHSFKMKQLYIDLSKKYNVSENNICWNIERAVKSLSHCCPITTFKKIFPDYHGTKNPSPTYLLTLIVEKIEPDLLVS